MKNKFPTTIVIFGITGDLAQKKILPALFDMYLNKKIDKNTRIIGFSRREMSEIEIRDYTSSVLIDEKNKDDFLKIITYVTGQFDDLKSYIKLSEHLQKLDDERNSCSNKLLYLSVPPTLYEMIAKNISQSGLSIPCGGQKGFTRILIEKPFGNDLKTAIHLDKLIGKLFKEEQIFRIDHYVAKKSLLDILNKHRVDKNFLHKWNNKNISKVEIKLFEKATVGNRGAFYDNVGAFRDVGQNHILQMLALVTMEISKKHTADEIQKSRAEILKKIIIPNKKDIAKFKKGQYVGYLSEPGVSSSSKTETFFSITAYLNDSKFKNIPFVISSGKALNKNLTEIIVHFKNWPKFVFNIPSEDSQKAYEKILLDCIAGDQTVFTSTEEILAQWRFVTPIILKWTNFKLFQYKIGSEPESF